MKPFLFVLICIFSISDSVNASNAFEIPRSTTVELRDPSSDRTYPIFIKLPPSYHHNKAKTYPVVYLLDAIYAFQIVSGATRFPMNTRKMREAIIVGISYEKGISGGDSRIRDFTPVRSQLWRRTTGGAAQHLAFIETKIFKYIEENYRVDNEDRTFMGNSLGGLFGTYVLLTKPDLFKNYILGSPSYWFDNNYIFRLEKSAGRSLPKIHANVFLGIGERETKSLDGRYDMVQDAQAFIEMMQAWNQPDLRVKLLVIPEANHQTAFPTTAIQGLHWLYGTK